jgi:hypothetical protein
MGSHNTRYFNPYNIEDLGPINQVNENVAVTGTLADDVKGLTEFIDCNSYYLRVRDAVADHNTFHVISKSERMFILEVNWQFVAGPKRQV